MPTAPLTLILLAMIAAVYWPVAGYEFVNLDDTYYVSLNRVVQQGLTLSGVRLRIPAMVTSQSGLMVTSNRSAATPVGFL